MAPIGTATLMSMIGIISTHRLKNMLMKFGNMTKIKIKLYLISMD